MRNMTCDICGKPIWNEEEASDVLWNLSKRFNNRLSEVCEKCIEDVAMLVRKHMDSKLEEKNKNLEEK